MMVTMSNDDDDDCIPNQRVIRWHRPWAFFIINILQSMRRYLEYLVNYACTLFFL